MHVNKRVCIGLCNNWNKTPFCQLHPYLRCLWLLKSLLCDVPVVNCILCLFLFLLVFSFHHFSEIYDMYKQVESWELPTEQKGTARKQRALTFFLLAKSPWDSGGKYSSTSSNVMLQWECMLTWIHPHTHTHRHTLTQYNRASGGRPQITSHRCLVNPDPSLFTCHCIGTFYSGRLPLSLCELSVCVRMCGCVVLQKTVGPEISLLRCSF